MKILVWRFIFNKGQPADLSLLKAFYGFYSKYNIFRSKVRLSKYPGEPIREFQPKSARWEVIRWSDKDQIRSVTRLIKENILENSVFSLGNDRKCFRKITWNLEKDQT